MHVWKNRFVSGGNADRVQRTEPAEHVLLGALPEKPESLAGPHQRLGGRTTPLPSCGLRNQFRKAFPSPQLDADLHQRFQRLVCDPDALPVSGSACLAPRVFKSHNRLLKPAVPSAQHALLQPERPADRRLLEPRQMPIQHLPVPWIKTPARPPIVLEPCSQRLFFCTGYRTPSPDGHRTRQDSSPRNLTEVRCCREPFPGPRRRRILENHGASRGEFAQNWSRRNPSFGKPILGCRRRPALGAVRTQHPGNYQREPTDHTATENRPHLV